MNFSDEILGDVLIVIAHPDDETIYFGGLISSLEHVNVDVLCVTNGDEHGTGAQRLSDLKRAASALGVRSVDNLDYRDDPVFHLPIAEIGEVLRERVSASDYRTVFTHSPHGEYGHLNHMDVSIAVHRSLHDRVCLYSIADAVYPDLTVSLTREQFEKKMHILSNIYFEELAGFWRELPLLPTETFKRFELAEAEAIYKLCTDGVVPNASDVPSYKNILQFIIRGQKKD